MKYVKIIFQVLLGAFMTYAGFSHLTIARQEFVAQVPVWLQFTPGFTDFIVLASGVVEITLGLGMLTQWKRWRGVVGALLALFYVAIFPGNINQYVEGINALRRWMSFCSDISRRSTGMNACSSGCSSNR